MFKKLIITVLIGSMMSGCAGFRENNLAQVKPEDMQMKTATKTKVFTQWSIHTAQKAAYAGPAAVNKEIFEKILIGCGCCDVVQNANEAEVIVTGETYPEAAGGTGKLGAVITGATLYVIPSWITTGRHISAVVKKGEVTRSYDLHDSMTMVQWFPMALLFPFANPMSMENEVVKNVYDTLLVNLKQDKFFK